MEDLVSVYVTCPDAACAEALGRLAVEERLAACANVLPGVLALYRWEGSLQRDEEVALLLKTRRVLFETLAARLQAEHPYALPCIVAWPIAAATAAYAEWVRSSTRPA